MKNNLTLENLSSAKEVVRSEKGFCQRRNPDERDFLFDHHTISILQTELSRSVKKGIDLDLSCLFR